MASIKCCLGCTDRALGCHSTCDIYLKEKAEYDKVKAKERKSIDREKDVLEFLMNKKRLK